MQDMVELVVQPAFQRQADYVPQGYKGWRGHTHRWTKATKSDTRIWRADYNYQHIRANKTNYASSFIVKTIPDEWNNLPKAIKSTSSVGAFNSRLAKFRKG